MQVELLTQELHATENEKGLQVKLLETQLEDTRQRLLGYEKIEKELDDIVMESAQSWSQPYTVVSPNIWGNLFHVYP